MQNERPSNRISRSLVVERPGMPLGSMSWRVRPPLVDDHRHRSMESCGTGYALDPLLNNACNDDNNIGSYPKGRARMVRWGEDIETKWFSGRSTTPT